MTKVLVLYYSAWGHMEQMAYAAAEGANREGSTVSGGSGSERDACICDGAGEIRGPAAALCWK